MREAQAVSWHHHPHYLAQHHFTTHETEVHRDHQCHHWCNWTHSAPTTIDDFNFLKGSRVEYTQRAILTLYATQTPSFASFIHSFHLTASNSCPKTLFACFIIHTEERKNPNNVWRKNKNEKCRMFQQCYFLYSGKHSWWVEPFIINFSRFKGIDSKFFRKQLTVIWYIAWISGVYGARVCIPWRKKIIPTTQTPFEM